MVQWLILFTKSLKRFRIVGQLALVAILILFIIVMVSILTNNKKTVRSIPTSCKIFAHRGCSFTAPENTIASLSESLKLDIDGSEIDVRSTKDGIIVLMHDETVDRVTDGTGKVKDLDFSYLRELDAGSWKNVKYAGEKIPTLIEALDICKDSNQDTLIDIKDRGISKQVIDIVKTKSMQDKVILITSSLDVIKQIKEIDPKIRCGWICENFPRYLFSKNAKMKWIHKQVRKHNIELLDLKYTFLSEKVISQFHEKGVEVWAWTVNEQEIMEALMNWDIDAITTDRPELSKSIKSLI